MSNLYAIPAMPLRPVLCGPGDEPSAPVVPGLLHVGLTLDEGDGTRRVTHGDLAAWGVTLDALLPLALERLAAESPVAGWHPVEPVPGLALYQALDGHSSARMLVLDRMLDDWPLGGVVVTVPSADQLMAVPLHAIDDLDALNVMVTAAQLAHGASDAPLSDQAFWTDGTRWEHVQVTHHDDTVQVVLPPQARLGITRLAALGMVAAAGEA